jgi:GNAT superfamily N-acetyltransferase
MLMNAIWEMAEAPVDGPVYLASILRTMRDGAALMAIVNGELVGYLGIVELSYSYARASFLIDSGFWIKPEHRTGDVFKALLQEARGIADAAGMIFKLIINNPSRKRGTRTDMERTSVILKYQPAGAVLTFHPRG